MKGEQALSGAWKRHCSIACVASKAREGCFKFAAVQQDSYLNALWGTAPPSRPLFASERLEFV